MPAYKDKDRGTWYAKCRYTDWKGVTHQKTKRGFARKKDAEAWISEFMRSATGSKSMTVSSLSQDYLRTMEGKVKESTMDTKRSIIEKHILPAFGSVPISDVSPSMVVQWQRELQLSDADYSDSYLRTIHCQLSAMFRYACRMYGISSNPCEAAGPMGSASAPEMKIWTLDEYRQFISAVDRPAFRLAFEVLFWSGLRVGETLALTPSDVLCRDGIYELSVTKTIYRKNGINYETEPKTAHSKRKVQIPENLYREIVDYESQLYRLQPHDQIFFFTRSTLTKYLAKYAEASSVKRIRIHDLRHSHVSMLIEMGQPITLISRRLGHKSPSITLSIYAHLYPGAGEKLAEELQGVWESGSLNDDVAEAVKEDEDF